jgi:MFS family permease
MTRSSGSTGAVVGASRDMPNATLPTAIGAPSLYAWYVAVVLSAAHLVSFIDRFVMGLLVQPMRATLGLSDAQLGLLQGSAFALLYAIAGVPLGRLADLRSRRVLIACGITFWSVATAACAFADGFWSLFGARLLVGVGEAALVPAAMSLLAAYFTRKHIGRAISIFTTGASLGKTTALIGGAALLTLFGSRTLSVGGHVLLPWQGVFLSAAMVGLVLVPLVLTIAEPPRRARDDAGGSGLRDALEYLKRNAAPFALHTIAAGAVVLLVQAFGAWAPAYFARVRGYSVVEAGYVVGFIALVTGPAGGLSGGWAIDRLHRAGVREAALNVILLGLSVALPMALLLITLPNGVGPLIAFAFFMFAISTTVASCLAGLQVITPERHRGTVTSIYMCVITLTAVGLGPLLVGVVSDLLAENGRSLGVALGGVTIIVGMIGIIAAAGGRSSVRRLATAIEKQD